MEFKFQLIFLLFCLLLVGSHQALPSQENYWRSLLPNSPMPKAVKDLLYPGKPVHVDVGVTPDAFPIIYHHGADENQLHHNKNVSRNSKRFSVNPSSEKAKIMKKTIQECEERGIKGEEKYCATSLESMVEFSTSKLGPKVEAVSFETEEETPLQKYRIVRVKQMSREKVVACHKQKYAYVVFYCHKTETTVAYKVAMVGDNGANLEAVAVCHKDTTGWNPRHLAFQVLKVKPGNIPICHFLPKDNIVWVPTD